MGEELQSFHWPPDGWLPRDGVEVVKSWPPLADLGGEYDVLRRKMQTNLQNSWRCCDRLQVAVVHDPLESTRAWAVKEFLDPGCACGADDLDEPFWILPSRFKALDKSNPIAWNSGTYGRLVRMGPGNKHLEGVVVMITSLEHRWNFDDVCASLEVDPTYDEGETYRARLLFHALRRIGTSESYMEGFGGMLSHMARPRQMHAPDLVIPRVKLRLAGITATGEDDFFVDELRKRMNLRASFRSFRKSSRACAQTTCDSHLQKLMDRMALRVHDTLLHLPTSAAVQLNKSTIKRHKLRLKAKRDTERLTTTTLSTTLRTHLKDACTKHGAQQFTEKAQALLEVRAQRRLREATAKCSATSTVQVLASSSSAGSGRKCEVSAASGVRTVAAKRKFATASSWAKKARLAQTARSALRATASAEDAHRPLSEASATQLHIRAVCEDGAGGDYRRTYPNQKYVQVFWPSAEPAAITHHNNRVLTVSWKRFGDQGSAESIADQLIHALATGSTKVDVTALRDQLQGSLLV